MHVVYSEQDMVDLYLVRIAGSCGVIRCPDAVEFFRETRPILIMAIGQRVSRA